MSLDRTQTFFHQYANDFDAIYGNQNGVVDSVINRLFRKSMRLRYEKSIEGCEPVQGKSVLDVGCGPGHYSITLAQRGAARVEGIDFAEGMLKLASEHARQVGVADRCNFKVADFYEYPANDPFDYVIVMGFMDYMPDPEKVVAKVLSLTRNKAFFSFPVAGGILGLAAQTALPETLRPVSLYREPVEAARSRNFPRPLRRSNPSAGISLSPSRGMTKTV